MSSQPAMRADATTNSALPASVRAVLSVGECNPDSFTRKPIPTRRTRARMRPPLVPAALVV